MAHTLTRISFVTTTVMMLSVLPYSTQAVTFNLESATIADINDAFDAGALTSKQLTQLYLNRINAYDQQGPNLNSIITINPLALETAAALDLERSTQVYDETTLPPEENPEYLLYLQNREELTTTVKNVFQTLNLDAFLYPTIVLKPSLIGEPYPEGYPANALVSSFTEFPAMVVPAGFTADGLQWELSC
ncbi:hypothetical protein [Iningainema tapete]|uniref:Amidase n=1 Tax=Iningainema tapete BLCC-T55 TaxID=2748662 RepID=A0A8J6XM44_9CYAN|nr:hypothetical protein [Iningainema tapete]MBD2774214.1 hypothetical protein [Iningainema tapete BLCC-T55]